MTDNASVPVAVPDSASQLALELFSAFPEAIGDSPRDIGFQKPESLLQVSHLSLLARKAINAAHFVISDSVQRQDGSFAVDQGYFTWLANFNSRNTPYLRKALTEAQGASIQALVLDATNQKRDAWTSVPLIGRVTIANGQVIFMADPAIVKLLKNQGSSAFLSLRISSYFDRKHSLELYEKVLPYRTVGATPWTSVSDMGKWVSLKSDETEFKYVKRDILDPAMKEINLLSDIRVAIDKRSAPGSRKIVEFRFLVAENPEGKMVIGSSHRKDLKEIYQILTEEFGLSDRQIDEVQAVAEAGGIERIRSAIDYTRMRVNDSKKGTSPIAVPAKYFLRALDGGWKLPKGKGANLLEDKKAADLVKDSSDRMLKEEVGKTSSLVQSFIEAAVNDHESAEQVWAAFAKTPGGKTILKKHGLDGGYLEALQNEAVHLPFGAYLTQQGKKKSAKSS